VGFASSSGRTWTYDLRINSPPL